MRQILIVLAVLAFAIPARAQSDMLMQAQAADVLSDLITATATRADARVDAMRKYLKEAGKLEAYDAAKPAGDGEKPLPFIDIFKGAVLFVRDGGGAQYADPSLTGMNDAQLTNELTECQVYNIQQFQHLMQQKKAVDSMRAFLKSAGELEKYDAWAKEHAPPVKPIPKTPAEVAAHMDEMITSAKAMAWTKAEARGMSQAEFERAWKERVAKYQAAVAKKVDGSKALAQSLSSPPPPAPAAPVAPATPIITGRGPAPVVAAPPPPTVQTQYPHQNSAASFQQRNDELWNRYDDD